MEVGPFAILPIEDVGSIGFELVGGPSCTSEDSYTVALDSAPLHGKVFGASSGTGKLSPWSPMTLSGADRMVARIPLAASRFAFGYPLDGAQCKSICTEDLMDGRVASCALGFFVYIDERGAVCGVNGLSRGDGLFFMGPFKLWTLCVPRLREHLHEASRVVPVTMEALRDRGAQGFCWVGPSEHFNGLVEPDVAARSWAHGAFFYFFAEAEHKRDCFFSIDEAPQTAVDKSRAEKRRASAVAGGSTAGSSAIEPRDPAPAPSPAAEAGPLDVSVTVSEQSIPAAPAAAPSQDTSVASRLAQQRQQRSMLRRPPLSEAAPPEPAEVIADSITTAGSAASQEPAPAPEAPAADSKATVMSWELEHRTAVARSVPNDYEPRKWAELTWGERLSLLQASVDGGPNAAAIDMVTVLRMRREYAAAVARVAREVSTSGYSASTNERIKADSQAFIRSAEERHRQEELTRPVRQRASTPTASPPLPSLHLTDLVGSTRADRLEPRARPRHCSLRREVASTLETPGPVRGMESCMR